jgi:hypothetical protein
MALETDPLMVSCLSPKYETSGRDQLKSHQDIEWSMEVKIDGFEGFGDLPPEVFAELIRTRVEESAHQGLRHMRRNSETPPQYHLEEKANLDFDMTTERLAAFETAANPFIGIFHLKGRAVVDAKLPISADEALMMVQRRLAQQIADRVANLTDEQGSPQD